MSEITLLRVTFGDRAEAEEIARAMVEERLAACVTLTPGESIFAWQGEIAAESEIVGLFKTRAGLAPELAARIARRHSYDLPAITWWTAAADDGVTAWIAAETDGEDHAKVS